MPTTTPCAVCGTEIGEDDDYVECITTGGMMLVECEPSYRQSLEEEIKEEYPGWTREQVLTRVDEIMCGFESLKPKKAAHGFPGAGKSSHI